MSLQKLLHDVPAGIWVVAGLGIFAAVVVCSGILREQREKAEKAAELPAAVQKYEEYADETSAVELARRAVWADSPSDRLMCVSPLIRSLDSSDAQRRLVAARCLSAVRHGNLGVSLGHSLGLQARIGSRNYEGWLADLSQDSRLGEILRKAESDEQYMVRHWLSRFLGKQLADPIRIAIVGDDGTVAAQRGVLTDAGFAVVEPGDQAEVLLEFAKRENGPNDLLVWDVHTSALIGLSESESLVPTCFDRRPGLPICLCKCDQAIAGRFCLRRDGAISPRCVYLDRENMNRFDVILIRLLLGNQIECVRSPATARATIQSVLVVKGCGRYVVEGSDKTVEPAVTVSLSIQVIPADAAQAKKTVEVSGEPFVAPVSPSPFFSGGEVRVGYSDKFTERNQMDLVERRFREEVAPRLLAELLAQRASP